MTDSFARHIFRHRHIGRKWRNPWSIIGTTQIRLKKYPQWRPVHSLYGCHVHDHHPTATMRHLLSVRADWWKSCHLYPGSSPPEPADFFAEVFPVYHSQQLLLPGQQQRAGSLPAGIATHIGFVPNNLSTEKVGATNALAFVIAMPIISCSNRFHCMKCCNSKMI